METNRYQFDESDFEPCEFSVEQEEVYVHRNIFSDVITAFRKNKLAIFCLILLSIIVIASLLAPLTGKDSNEHDVLNRIAPSSSEHWFGTDELGRDYFTRALYGGRISLTVGFLSMILSVTLGTLIGTISGYVGGKVDIILMRFTDIFMSVPSFLLMVVINTIFPPKVWTMIVILGLFEWCQVGRITRAETLAVKEREYVMASKNLGASHLRVIFRHIIPNIMPSVIVAGSLAVARAILTESALSYMGIGVQLPKASWGTMLQGAQQYILNRPTLSIYPGLLIMLTVLSFNVLGDVLRDTLDPKSIK